MSQPQSKPANTPGPISDSPWFWATLFCAFGIVLLLVIFPRYQARQRRLEMQYMAREEIVRRQAAGEERARPVGDEGTAAPPALGDLIIPLWPLLALFTTLLVISAWMLKRTRGTTAQPAHRLHAPDDLPRGGEP